MRNRFGVIVVLALVLCLSAGVCHAQPAEPGPLKVGIATADITPEGPVWMAGFGARKKPSEGVYKNIEASCVVFDNGVTRVGLMAIDVCKIGVPQLEKVREAAQKVGIPPQHMMINSSHTHCGPTIIGKKNADYVPVFEERICDLLQTAVDDLQQATLDYTVGFCAMAINRRQLGPDGKAVGMRPEPRKPIDPDVPILRVLSPEGTVRAVIFGYACHPTTIGPATPIGYKIGPDFVGYARDWIAAAYPGCLPVFFQGCGGDIKPRYTKPNGRFGYVLLDAKETVAEMGHELGRAVIAATCVPLQPVPAEPAEGIQLGGIVEHVKVPDKNDAEKSHTIYMGAWRVGDVYIFGSQCELAVKIGLRIKRELSDLRVWTNGYTHWGGGYIQDAASYPEGGYEVNVSRVSPATEDIVVGNAIRYITELQTNPVHADPIAEPAED